MTHTLVFSSCFSDLCVDMIPFYQCVVTCLVQKGLRNGFVICCKNNVCPQISIIAAIQEKVAEAGKKESSLSVDSRVHHQIFNSNKILGLLSFPPPFSVDYASACLIAMFKIGNLNATLALIAQASKIKGQEFENVPLSAPI